MTINSIILGFPKRRADTAQCFKSRHTHTKLSFTYKEDGIISGVRAVRSISTVDAEEGR